jgi:hypothetical protein
LAILDLTKSAAVIVAKTAQSAEMYAKTCEPWMTIGFAANLTPMPKSWIWLEAELSIDKPRAKMKLNARRSRIRLDFKAKWFAITAQASFDTFHSD